MFKNVEPKWYIGVLISVVAILFLIFVATPMQINWGMTGLALTQIGFLLIGLAVPLMFRWKVSEVIPLKKPSGKQLFGTLVLYIATFTVVTATSLMITYFFPGMQEVAEDLGGFFTTVPFIAAIFVVAVMPGICEEVLFRGAIQYTLKKIENKFAVMLIVAILFGAFHLSPYRFFQTAILGFVLAYLLIKTGNFILPMLLHFINNLISVSAGFFAAGATEGHEVASAATATIGLESIGIYLVLCGFAPILYYSANRLLTGDEKNKKNRNIAWAIGAALFIIGIIIFAMNIDLSEAMNSVV